MRIECGPTTERVIRNTLLLIFIALFAAWFAYDGWKGWPEQNHREFLEQIPVDERPLAAKGPIYDSVTEKSVEQADACLRQGTGVAAQKAALAKLYGGPPTYENARGWYYFGPVYRVTLPLDLGGPAMKAAGQRGQRGVYDLVFQKFLAIGLGGFALFMAWFVMRIRRTRVVLDEGGLTSRDKGPIRWEDMKALDISRFARKGCVDLVYNDNGTERSLRLNEYHVAAFEDVIDALCARKGFENPLPVKEAAPEPAMPSQGLESTGGGPSQTGK
jgi:hypothetical protein